MTADVKEIFTQSAVAKDPKRLNTFMFLLDQEGRLVHGFHGLPGRGDGRSDYKEEIAKGLAMLKLTHQAPVKERPVVLPDLKTAGALAGVRMFLRQVDQKGNFTGQMPVVEVIPMNAAEWKVLAYPEKARNVEAEALRSWLVQLYPPAIRTVDQTKPFQKITGLLKLVPAGADKQARYALLSGEFRLTKGDDKESAFEGSLQVVLTYRAVAPEVQSVRGVIEGDYLYRIKATQRMPLKVALESRPQ